VLLLGGVVEKQHTGWAVGVFVGISFACCAESMLMLQCSDLAQL
jgi:hypothetical protein